MRGSHGPAKLQCTSRSWALGAQAMRAHTGQRAWVLHMDNKWMSSSAHAPAGFRPTASRRTDGQACLARGKDTRPGRWQPGPPSTHWCCRSSCSFSSCFSDSRRFTCISWFIMLHCRSESFPFSAVMV